MKSLLVDVLREARNNADAKSGTPSPGESTSSDARYSDSAGGLATQSELRILDAESDAHFLETGSALPGDDDEHAMLLPILDAAEHPGAINGAADPLGTTGWLTAAGANVGNSAGRIAILGRWSPALCVASMLLAASVYEVLQSVMAGSLNTDLSNVSQQVSHATARQEFAIDKPGNTGVFRFNAGKNPDDQEGIDSGDTSRTADCARQSSLSPDDEEVMIDEALANTTRDAR